MEKLSFQKKSNAVFLLAIFILCCLASSHCLSGPDQARRGGKPEVYQNDSLKEWEQLRYGGVFRSEEDSNVSQAPIRQAKAIASSPSFTLIAGFASILSLMLTLYRTQVRNVPFSYFRSLVWRPVLVVSLSSGILVSSLIRFYVQSPAPGVEAARWAYAFLHGTDIYDPRLGGSGTMIWVILFLLGAVLLISGIIYDPIQKIRNILVKNQKELEKARRSEIRGLLGNKSFDQLSDLDKRICQETMLYYSQLQTRMLDFFLGASDEAPFHKKLVKKQDIDDSS